MQNTENSAHSQLLLRIEQLKINKTNEERRIKNTYEEVLANFNPSLIIKTSLHELALDSVVQFDMTKMGLYAAANFAIDKIFGKNKTLKGFINSLTAERFDDSNSDNKGSFIIPILADSIISIFRSKTGNNRRC